VNQGPSIQKKMTILFFVYVGTHNNKIHTNQCFCFDFFHVVVLLLLAKQQQQKIINLYTISVCYAWALV
jgi:predicted nucleic acid-binding Zn finger protein